MYLSFEIACLRDSHGIKRARTRSLFGYIALISRLLAVCCGILLAKYLNFAIRFLVSAGNSNGIWR